ncbi:MAG: hypothetical protein K2J77_04625 [Oscillospiraceae bacterium]|nr:hypothetical protein [Oscillospiraceae bacterium]
MGVSRVGYAAAFSNAASSVSDYSDYSERSATVARQSSRDRADFSESAREASSEQSFSELIKEQTDKIDRMFSKNDEAVNELQLNSIKMKLRSGMTLSADEEKYLEKHDPDGYTNYRTTLDARRMFRAQLSCCRTKDDVNGMRLSNALSALSAYKKAMKNGGDGSAIAGLNMALEREISDYTKSARFKSLPTAAERDKYYMELAKARRFEREKRAAEKLNATRKKKKQIKQIGDGKRTVAQVENSPLGRKVRNAGKGGACLSYSASLMTGSYKKMDQKG